MSVREKEEQLRDMRKLAELGGGQKRIEAQHAKGKQTARERVEMMLDPGSFHELDMFVTHRTTDFGLADKKFHGDLEATSKGQMLGAFTAVEGSGAYVALEQMTGTLNGKKGSFMLQHNGTMRKGSYNMSVTVVPDSGTEELTGISGSMTIIIEGGKHSYVFEYAFEGK